MPFLKIPCCFYVPQNYISLPIIHVHKIKANGKDHLPTLFENCMGEVIFFKATKIIQIRTVANV